MADVYEVRWTHSKGGTALVNGELTATAVLWLPVIVANAERITRAVGKMREKALADVENGEKAYPPTLLEFEAMCLGPKEHWEHRNVRRGGERARAAITAQPAKPETITTEIGKMRAGAAEDRPGRRAIYSAGCGPLEHDRAIADGRTQGKTMYEINMQACARNGWTEHDEEMWRHNAHVCGTRPYPEKHGPDGR